MEDHPSRLTSTTQEALNRGLSTDSRRRTAAARRILQAPDMSVPENPVDLKAEPHELHELHELRENDADHHRETIRRTGGTLTDCYPSGYLTQSREDWPE